MKYPSRCEFLKAAAAGSVAASAFPVLIHTPNADEHVQGSTPPVRIALIGPALLTNDSYFEGRPIAWDPEAMRRHA